MAELDPAFEEFRRRWAARLKMNDHEAAQAFMRGEAIDLAPSGTLNCRPGQIRIYLRVNGRGLDGVADLGALDDMIAEWQAFLDAEPEANPRSFAKQLVVKAVGWNQHTHPEVGPLAICAALWLASSDPQALDEMRKGEDALMCDFTLDHDTGVLRTRIGLVSESEEPSAG